MPSPQGHDGHFVVLLHTRIIKQHWKEVMENIIGHHRMILIYLLFLDSSFTLGELMINLWSLCYFLVDIENHTSCNCDSDRNTFVHM